MYLYRLICYITHTLCSSNESKTMKIDSQSSEMPLSAAPASVSWAAITASHFLQDEIWSSGEMEKMNRIQCYPGVYPDEAGVGSRSVPAPTLLAGPAFSVPPRILSSPVAGAAADLPGAALRFYGHRSWKLPSPNKGFISRSPLQVTAVAWLRPGHGMPAEGMRPFR